MSDSLKIRPLTSTALGFADAVRGLAGWNQLPGDWLRLLRHDPNGCFIAEWNGQPAGTATTTTYSDDLAWIGMVIVHPDMRRKGIGNALLEHCIQHLQESGVRCIKLDATPLGKTVYDQLGFKDEWSLARWESDGLVVNKAEAEPIRADIDELQGIDTESFGVNRSRMLEALAAQSHTVVQKSAENRVEGYGMLRPGRNASYLGPFVAANETAGQTIVNSLLALSEGRRIFWDIPDQNTAAVELAKSLGFAQQRVLTRMYLGENTTPGDPGSIWALAAPEIG